MIELRLKGGKLEGVSNTIKEFSENYDSLYNAWKYTVEQDETGVNIKYMEKINGEWREVSLMNVSFSCANKLFKEVAEALEKGDFTGNY